MVDFRDGKRDGVKREAVKLSEAPYDGIVLVLHGFKHCS
jgi:hypothetical protein